jgi:hypothetical protein
MARREKNPSQSLTEEMIRRLENFFPQGSDLVNRLVQGLRIPAFGPARHFIRQGEAQREFYPDRCWAITAMPSFHSRGLFAVFEGRSLVRCAFVCKGDIPDKPALDFVVVDSFFESADWTDPVIDILTKGPLAPVPDRSYPEGTIWATCDGIGYLLQVATPDVNATLRFSNPRSSHYRSLERAACDVARRVSRVIEHPQVSSFVKTWLSYVRD